MTALLGGSRVQVTGPTAAFVVDPGAGRPPRFGLGGLLLATVMAGILLVILGVSGLGRLVEFVPFPVTTGFTAGIAVVIATLQLPDFLGLTVARMPEHYLSKLGALAAALPTAAARRARRGRGHPGRAHRLAAVLAAHPGPAGRRSSSGGVVAYVLALVGARLRRRHHQQPLHVRGQRRHARGNPPPAPAAAAAVADARARTASRSSSASTSSARCAPAAFAIAMLGAIESLLSAVVADGMTGHKHDPDAELVAQGIGNIVAPFFGGFAATGALARTATNVRAGRALAAGRGRPLHLPAAWPWCSSPRSSATCPWRRWPRCCCSWPGTWASGGTSRYTVRRAPRSDVAVLLACFGLTVVFDMVVAVTVGVVLSSLLFMRRMAEVSGARLIGPEHPELDVPLPRGVLLYEIAGPLFFGAAQKALAAITVIDRREVRTVVLDVRSVPALDATGLVALESLIKRLNARGIKVILAGVQPQPMRVFARAGWRNRRGFLRIFRSFDRAIALARHFAPGATGA